MNRAQLLILQQQKGRMLSSQNMNKLRYWMKWSGVIVFEEWSLCGDEFMNDSFNSCLDQRC